MNSPEVNIHMYHHLGQNKGHYHHSLNQYPLNSQRLFWILTPLVNFACFWILYKWNHIFFFGIWSISINIIFWLIHIIVCHCVHSFLLLCNSPRFIHFAFDGHLDHLWLLTLAYNASISILVHVFWYTCALHFVMYILRSGTAVWQNMCMFNVFYNIKLFSKVMPPFHTSPSSRWEYLLLHVLANTW